MNWLEELSGTGRVRHSRVPKGEIARVELWCTAGLLIRHSSGRGDVYQVPESQKQKFSIMVEAQLEAMRLEAPQNRREAASLHGNSKRAKSLDGLCSYFLVADASEGVAPELMACRTSDFHLKMLSHGLKAPKVGLVENLDVFLEWRDSDLEGLGLSGCDVVLLTRGKELIRGITWQALLRANVAEVLCAFDFDAAGLSFYRSAKVALGECCRVAWPRDMESRFEAQRQMGQGGDLRANAPIDVDFCERDADGAVWMGLLVRHGVGVEQQAFLDG